GDDARVRRGRRPPSLDASRSRPRQRLGDGHGLRPGARHHRHRRRLPADVRRHGGPQPSDPAPPLRGQRPDRGLSGGVSTMATLSQVTQAATDRTRRRIALFGAVVVAGWSLVELVGLVFNDHTTGPELYGVLVAALAVGAGALTLWLLVSGRKPAWA